MKYIINWSLFESNSYKLPEKVADRLTEDGEGNYVFYHYSSAKRDIIIPGTGQNTLLTSREEASALSSVGGLAMYYVRPNYAEPGVGRFMHIVKVPIGKVYDFNSDPLFFYEESKDKFEKIYDGVNRPKLAFNPNYQLAWITKLANERGFDMVVCRWSNNELRAQTTLSLEPESIIEK